MRLYLPGHGSSPLSGVTGRAPTPTRPYPSSPGPRRSSRPGGGARTPGAARRAAAAAASPRSPRNKHPRPAVASGAAPATNGFYFSPLQQQYQEDPAEFKPLTEDELQRIKRERRNKDAQRKQKAQQDRKHLANVRVVQRNLVFVVGLSQRIADSDVLKRNEFFGRFGKIHKVVVNKTTSYAGAQSSSQGPSASAYVTFYRFDDTLRAIQAVNNTVVDGRTLKASLGTTKYCSHFLKGSQCPKPDCMYLHDLGDQLASFTKEEMQQGKHTEYENQLIESYVNTLNLTQQQPAATTSNTQPHTGKQRKKASSPQMSDGSSQGEGGGSGSRASPASTPPAAPPAASTPPAGGGSGGAWPSLSLNSSNTGSAAGTPNSQSPETVVIGRTERMVNGTKSKSKHSDATTDVTEQQQQQQQHRAPGHHRSKHSNTADTQQNSTRKNTPTPTHSASSSGGSAHELLPPSVTPPAPPSLLTSAPHSVTSSAAVTQSQPHHMAQSVQSRLRGVYGGANDSMSLFSSGTGFSTNRQNHPPLPPTQQTESLPVTEIAETLPVASTTDWQAAFGFGSTAASAPAAQPSAAADDDLGFDPWDESTKGLADLIEKETTGHSGGGMTSFPVGFPGAGYPGAGMGYLPPTSSSNPPPGLHSRLQMGGVGGMGGHPGHPGVGGAKNLPPGLTRNHIGAFNTSVPPPSSGFTGSKMLGMMQGAGGSAALPPAGPPPNLHMPPGHAHHHHGAAGFADMQQQQHHQKDVFNMKDWQEGLRALLPNNINIHFGTPPHGAAPPPPPPQHDMQHPHNDWLSEREVAPLMAPPPAPAQADLSGWDPAIVTSGSVAPPGDLGGDDPAPPHWLASLQHLTDDTAATSNHRLPFVQQFPSFNTAGVNWATQSQLPPPGFQSGPLRQHSQTDTHTQLEAGVQ